MQIYYSFSPKVFFILNKSFINLSILSRIKHYFFICLLKFRLSIAVVILRGNDVIIFSIITFY